jgi:hypothetical protein
MVSKDSAECEFIYEYCYVILVLVNQLARSSAYISENLAHAIRVESKNDRAITVADVSTYIGYILVPEMATLLVMEDMNVDEEGARKIMEESNTLGDVVNGDRWERPSATELQLKEKAERKAAAEAKKKDRELKKQEREAEWLESRRLTPRSKRQAMAATVNYDERDDDDLESSPSKKSKESTPKRKRGEDKHEVSTPSKKHKKETETPKKREIKKTRFEKGQAMDLMDEPDEKKPANGVRTSSLGSKASKKRETRAKETSKKIEFMDLTDDSEGKVRATGVTAS